MFHGIHSLHHTKGLGLIEILVSLVVLAVGLLGLASLQLTSLQFNHDSYLRSVAVNQTQDIIDRMRSNMDGVENNQYDNVSGIPNDPGCTTCSASQIAQKDIREWNQQNAVLLPSGQGTITRNGQIFNITLYWDARRTGATGTDCSGDFSVDLMCLIMSIQL